MKWPKPLLDEPYKHPAYRCRSKKVVAFTLKYLITIECWDYGHQTIKYNLICTRPLDTLMKDQKTNTKTQVGAELGFS